jgi:hypothetical protein
LDGAQQTTLCRLRAPRIDDGYGTPSPRIGEIAPQLVYCLALIRQVKLTYKIATKSDFPCKYAKKVVPLQQNQNSKFLIQN